MAKARKPTLISQREFARRLGVSPEAVRVAIKAGRISTVKGRINPTKARKEWERNTDQSKPRNIITGDPKHRRDPSQPETPMDLGKTSRANRKSAGTKAARKPVSPKDAPEPAPAADDYDPDDSGSYSEARAAREFYQAQLARLKYEEQAGLLVRADQVAAEAFSRARRTRDQLGGIPERVSAIIAGIDDATEVQRILEDEIDRISQELSDADRG